MTVTFKPNRAGFREMAVGPELQAAVLAIAEEGKKEAEGIAAEFSKTGEYASSFVVYPHPTQLRTAFGTHEVAAARLENVAPYSTAVEWGNTHDHRKHRVFGRILDGFQRHE